MIPPVSDSKGASDWNATIEGIQRLMTQLCAEPGLGTAALSVPDWDRELWCLGGAWLEAHRAKRTGNEPHTHADGPDVYLATQVASDGGHTALIGDFVRSLDDGSASGVSGARSHLIVTNLDGANHSPLP